MKILHVQKVAGVGGSERHLLTLLPALADLGHEVRMLVIDASGSGPFIEMLAAAGVPVEVIRGGAAADPRVGARILRQIRRGQPDLVHTHLVHADIHGLPAARIAGIPAVSTFHNVDPSWRTTPVRTAARIAYRGAARVIAISSFVRTYVESLRLVDPARTVVVPYGIEAQTWAADEREVAAARSSLGLSATDIAVGMAARLVEGKGHDTLIAATASVTTSLPDLQVLLAGDGPLRGSIEARSAGLPVRILGYVDDVRPFMHACDVLAFPTASWLGEGFGLAALEAMAAGLPVIASDAGALPEVVGDAGVIVPAGSAPELAAALLRLGTDAELRDRLGRAAAERAGDVFSLERMVDATSAIYEQVAR